MSDIPPGPGYWKASDGQWYPPEQHPNYQPPQYSYGSGPQDATALGADNPTGYPVRFTHPGPVPIARWRAFLHIFMAIPHYIVLYVLNIVSEIVALISWFAILFTGRIPKGLFDLQVMRLRYNNRFIAFLILLHDQYPPFEFDTTVTDPGTAPGRTEAVYQLENRNRLTTAFRFILIIPQAIALAVVGIAAFVAYVIGWFGVLFTGQMPDGIAKFLIGYGRWTTRVTGYFLLLTDEYPPFTLE